MIWRTAFSSNKASTQFLWYLTGGNWWLVFDIFEMKVEKILQIDLMSAVRSFVSLWRDASHDRCKIRRTAAWTAISCVLSVLVRFLLIFFSNQSSFFADKNLFFICYYFCFSVQTRHGKPISTKCVHCWEALVIRRHRMRGDRRIIRKNISGEWNSNLIISVWSSAGFVRMTFTIAWVSIFRLETFIDVSDRILTMF